MTVPSINLARAAIREYDGANAKGQPIKLTLMPSGPSRGAGRPDNPFDRVEPPRRSLFDRVERPRDRSASPISADGDDSYHERRRNNSRRGAGGGGPRDRRSDVTKPPPEHIDRYVPGQDSYSPPPRRRGGGGGGPARETGRRPGQRRENSGRRGGGRDRDRDDGGHQLVNGRPRKTAEELDQEMEDYWGNAGAAANTDTDANGASRGVVSSQNGNVTVEGPGVQAQGVAGVAVVEAPNEGLGEVDMGIIE